MSVFIDLVGQKFGRLTVVERAKNNKGGSARWLCQCKCDKRVVVQASNLKNKNTQSCGCLQKEMAYKSNYVHGCCDKNNPTYQTWQQMVQRCTNPNNKSYKNYGSRGIHVCEAWLKFENFLQDMGKHPKGMTLDRVDNDGNYCKENCRWTTYKQQNRNYRRNILIKINDETKCLMEWCERYGLKYQTIYMRLRRGWTIEEALELTIRRKNVTPR